MAGYQQQKLDPDFVERFVQPHYGLMPAGRTPFEHGEITPKRADEDDEDDEDVHVDERREQPRASTTSVP